MLSIQDQTIKILNDSNAINYRNSKLSLSSLCKSFALHRKSIGLSLTSISELTGLDVEILEKFESGEYCISDEKIMVLCDIYSLNKVKVMTSISIRR